jgi:ribosomal-protein-alanine N-acetyltransferase
MSDLEFPRAFPFADPALPLGIDRMQVTDLEQVMQIERVAFPSPWPLSAYRYELTQNDLSTYLVLRERQVSLQGRTRGTRSGPPTGFLGRVLRRGLWGRVTELIVAYGGFWSILDEAHVSTIAVHPDRRGRGLGEMMLVALIDASVMRGATGVTLEVRVSNQVAQNLYAKYAFREVGLRKRYYHDNNEDALIMTLSELAGATFQAKYKALKSALRAALIEEVREAGALTNP